ncbi:glycosyltransferase [Pantoea sp. 18069]|uniref:glycosyltransferase n=1 Tax=Pantoea sp. 18069 TaxID=2681415 RepID=UPI0013574299|nr:glycosyltransferase [Pantoea sp. 18069]
MRVLHFVTGGFSGATQVAVDLCLAAQRSQAMPVLLVLRRKRNTDAARVQALRDQGLDVRVVPGWSHAATIWALRRIAREWKPDILVAHGFSDHLWGRYAGLLAGVPKLVHVEHNSRERYTGWRLRQALWLDRRSAASVGVSRGVRDRLLALGFARERCVAIPNGIDLARFPVEQLQPWAQRAPAIVMASRFARQKDHATLIEALALLGEQGLRPRLFLAGGGKARLRDQAQALVAKLGLGEQVEFMGQVAQLPQFLMRQQLFVLSTHYEGMPLALTEAMAAGCACIGSDVVGVREVIAAGRTGLLVPEGDAAALAQALRTLLEQPEYAQSLARAARAEAEAAFDVSVMQAGYEALLRRVHAGMKSTP